MASIHIKIPAPLKSGNRQKSKIFINRMTKNFIAMMITSQWNKHEY